MRLGVLGGTFDPVHFGHLLLGETAREEVGLDVVVFVPAGHPWRKADREITPAAHRLGMLRRATQDNPNFEVSTLEIDRDGPSYTDVTLEAIQAERPGADLFFIVGRDAVADMPNWKAPQRIVELATLVVAERAGADALPLAETLLMGLSARIVMLRMPRLEISATGIRERARNGRSIRYLAPAAVWEYIERQNIYSQ